MSEDIHNYSLYEVIFFVLIFALFIKLVVHYLGWT